jgi:heme/copper-type cytochrome/quinol oxidase subunit 3
MQYIKTILNDFLKINLGIFIEMYFLFLGAHLFHVFLDLYLLVLRCYKIEKKKHMNLAMPR